MVKILLNFQNGWAGFLIAVCVDFFFLVSGFFLFLKIKPSIDIFEFAKKRFFRLAPNVWISVILLGILSIIIKGIHWDLDGNILRIFLLHNVGFCPVTGGTNIVFSWFVSSLFWTSLFYAYIFKIFEKKYLNLIIWLLVVLSYALYVQSTNFDTAGLGTGAHVKNVYFIFNIGICRALASMGLGYFLSMFYKEEFFQKKQNPILISLLEGFFIAFLFNYMIFSKNLPCETSLGYIVPFAILFYFMLIKKGIFSKLLDNDLLASLGKYSYSIYCFHGLVLAVFEQYIFKLYPSILMDYPLFSYFLQTFCAVAVGIVLYYIFEQPIANYIKNKGK